MVTLNLIDRKGKKSNENEKGNEVSIKAKKYIAVKKGNWGDNLDCHEIWTRKSNKYCPTSTKGTTNERGYILKEARRRRKKEESLWEKEYFFAAHLELPMAATFRLSPFLLVRILWEKLSQFAHFSFEVFKCPPLVCWKQKFQTQFSRPFAVGGL